MSKETDKSLTKFHSHEVFAENVSNIDVARAYLNAELPNILGENITSSDGTMKESLTNLSNKKVMRLLEGLSYAYRMNGVFHTVTDEANDWLDVELPIDAITLTGIKPHINDIVYSARIGNRPLVFAEYLSDYFGEHPETCDDPQNLNEFRPRTTVEEMRHTRLLTAERSGAIEIVDGAHRLLSTAILGAVSIRAFAAVPNGKESISMKGDSTFLTMRLQYEEARTDEERECILSASLLLARSSTDGAGAIQSYWIDHPRGEEIKTAGRNLIARLKLSQ